MELRVRDHGPGIPLEQRSLVFERFLRGPHNAGIPGSGIGLAVVSTLVSQMEGEVSVEDGEGGGAVFLISLRRCPDPSEPSLQPHRH